MIEVSVRGREPMSENAFSSQSKTVGDLLSTNQQAQIVVPEFQRGYSWEKQHVKAFWDDITDPKRSKRYFLGPIVLMKKSDTVIELLDGQQRLATAIILFSVLRDAADKLGFKEANVLHAFIHRDYIVSEDGRRSLVLGEMDDTYFRAAVQDQHAEKHTTKATLRSQRHIAEARQVLVQAVNNAIAMKDQFESLHYLKDLRDKIRYELVLACISVDSDGEAFQIFETLNDRGLRLSVPDLLLNFLMKVAPQEDRKHIRKAWNDMITLMGRRDISKFIRHLWVSQYGDLKNENLFQALKTKLTSRESLGSLTFVQTCLTECQNYVALLTASKEHLSEAAPHVHDLVHEVAAQSSLPMLLSAYSKFDKSDFANVVKWLLVFVTRWSVLMGQDASSLETQLFLLARSIRDTPENDKIKKAKLGEIKDILMNLSPTNEQIGLAVERLILPVDGADYVVRKLADAMQSKTKETKTGHESNLEHIYPQNPDENSWGGEANQALLEPYTWHIGNLTMLGERLNRKAKNSEYDIKQQKYANSELEMPREIAAKYATWDINSIEQRAKSLVPLVVSIWDFDNPSRV